MSSNTIRVIQSLDKDIPFDPEDWADDTRQAMNKTAAERNMRIDEDTFRYVGETTLYGDYPDNIRFYAYVAEAI